MAYAKSDTTDKAVKKTTKTTTNTKPKTTTATTKAPSTAAKSTSAQDAEIAALKAQIELLTKLVMNSNNSMPVSEPEAPTTSKTKSLDDEIKIIHLVERDKGLTTHIQLSNITIDFNSFGEERTLDRRQAEELAGKYRSFFDKGIIAFGADSEDVAEKCGLKTVKSYPYAINGFVEKLSRLSLPELENLYVSLCDGHKAFIIEHFKRGVIKGDPLLADIHKIELLDRLSDGAMTTTLQDMRRK